MKIDPTPTPPLATTGPGEDPTQPDPSTSLERWFTDDELRDISEFVDSDILALLGQC